VDAVEQLQVVTSGGHAELVRALGGFVNVINAQRHQRLSRRRLRLPSAIARLNAPNRPDGHPSADDPDAGRRQHRRSAAAGPQRSSLPISSGANLDQAGLTTIAATNVETINARLRAVAYPGKLGDEPSVTRARSRTGSAPREG
jgi:hypothetical protein